MSELREYVELERIRKAEHLESSHTEPLGRATRLQHARRGQLWPRWNLREITNALGAVGGDQEMGLASFPREPRQQRVDDAPAVGVGEPRRLLAG